MSGTRKRTLHEILVFHVMKKLPREVRDEIYAYVLAGDITIPMFRLTKTSGTVKLRPRGQGLPIPPLLKVCRQIRHEATPIYHATNIFRAVITNDNDSWKLPFAWIKTLRKDEKRKVNKLIIEFQLSTMTEAKFQAMWDGMVADVQQPGQHPLFAGLSLLAGLRSVSNVDWFRQIHAEMCRTKADGFDLKKIEIVGGDKGNMWDKMSRGGWTEILEDCLEAAKEGRDFSVKET